MPKFRWIAGLRQHDNYHGIVFRRVGDPHSHLVTLWADDASPAEIADALDKLSKELREQSDA